MLLAFHGLDTESVRFLAVRVLAGMDRARRTVVMALLVNWLARERDQRSRKSEI